MVNQFAEWIARIVAAWKFWIVVPPWEVGLRVRLGSNAVRLDPGPHWRIPFVDVVLLVNTRTRVTTIPPVTLRQPEGVKCMTAVVGFRIHNPLVAVQTYEHPAIAVQGMAQAEIAKDQTAEQVQEALSIAFKSCITIEFIQYTEDVEVPGLRLLQGTWTVASENHSGNDERVRTRY